MFTASETCVQGHSYDSQALLGWSNAGAGRDLLNISCRDLYKISRERFQIHGRSWRVPGGPEPLQIGASARLRTENWPLSTSAFQSSTTIRPRPGTYVVSFLSLSTSCPLVMQKQATRELRAPCSANYSFV